MNLTHSIKRNIIDTVKSHMPLWTVMLTTKFSKRKAKDTLLSEMKNENLHAKL